ncbi:MAG TPA: hypothetical protein VF719_00620 [Abditibacteriaceae bacterium]
MVYFLFWVRHNRGEPASDARPLALLGKCSAFCLTIVFVGLWIASRGTIGQKEFWSGWLEALLGVFAPTGSVALLLPLAIYPGLSSLLLFVFVTTVYLMLIAPEVVRLWLGYKHTGRAAADATIIACIAGYGLMAMLKFIGRSNPLNLFQPIIPFCLVSACLVSQWHRYLLLQKIRTRPLAAHQKLLLGSALPVAALCALVFMIGGLPSFRAYGSAFKQVGGSTLLYQRTDIDLAEGCLLQQVDDICGLPASEHHYFKPFDQLTNQLRVWAKQKHSVAVLDDSDTVLYLAAGIAPWSRYSPLFTSSGTPAKLQKLLQDLQQHPPDYALIRKDDRHTGFFNTKRVWSEVHRALPRSFVRQSELGHFEIWRRKGLAAPA